MKNKKLSISIPFSPQLQRILMQIYNSMQINSIFMRIQSIQSMVKDLILKCMLCIFQTRFLMELWLLLLEWYLIQRITINQLHKNKLIW